MAFSFFGDPNSTKHQKRGYFDGIKKNLDAISSVYNNSWTVRLYHDISPNDFLMVDLCNLSCSNALLDLCPVHQLPHPLFANATHMFPMIWRFMPTLDPQVDVFKSTKVHLYVKEGPGYFCPLSPPQVDLFMSRDLDSAPTQREADAVEEWLRSGKTLHVMRDHPSHTFPMLGGSIQKQTKQNNQK